MTQARGVSRTTRYIRGTRLNLERVSWHCFVQFASAAGRPSLADQRTAHAISLPERPSYIKGWPKPFPRLYITPTTYHAPDARVAPVYKCGANAQRRTTMEALNAVLRDPRVQRALENPAVKSGAALGAVAIALRLYFARKKKLEALAKARVPKHITNFAEVARKVKQAGEYDVDEFDVIVVGGGVCRRAQSAGCAHSEGGDTQAPRGVLSLRVLAKTLPSGCSCWKRARGMSTFIFPETRTMS